MKIRKVVLLGSLVAACLLLLTLQMRGYGEVARDVFAVVTTPIQTGLAKASRADMLVERTGDLFSIGLRWRHLGRKPPHLCRELGPSFVQEQLAHRLPASFHVFSGLNEGGFARLGL